MKKMLLSLLLIIGFILYVNYGNIERYFDVKESCKKYCSQEIECVKECRKVAW